ncbi:MAG: hypothetical protein IJD78_08195 [Clostridia bacterium]|nr:hypothetical protein [Clostridia bacterium]
MDKKNMRLTFYVVCGLLLGAPYIWRLVKLVPEIFEKLPNAKEILSASGYAVLVIASIVIAYKLSEAIWIRIISIYSSVGLAVCIITMMTRALGASEIFEVLYELVCAPFFGIESPMAVTVLMLVLSVTAYVFLNKMPQKPKADGGNS